MSEFCPENTMSPNEHTWTHSKRTGRRWCRECGEAAPQPVRVHTIAELKVVAAKLGVRPDWHEPEEQEVTAKVYGQSFDNAGTWPMDLDRAGDRFAATAPESEALEMYVELHKDGLPVAIVNLATLFAMACGTVQ